MDTTTPQALPEANLGDLLFDLDRLANTFVQRTQPRLSFSFNSFEDIEKEATTLKTIISSPALNAEEKAYNTSLLSGAKVKVDKILQKLSEDKNLADPTMVERYTKWKQILSSFIS